MAWTMEDLPYQPEQYTRTFLQPVQRSSWQRSGCQPGCQRPDPRNSSKQKGSWRREPAGYSSRHWAGWQSLLRGDKRERWGRVTLGHRQRTWWGQTVSAMHHVLGGKKKIKTASGLRLQWQVQSTLSSSHLGAFSIYKSNHAFPA